MDKVRRPMRPPASTLLLFWLVMGGLLLIFILGVLDANGFDAPR